MKVFISHVGKDESLARNVAKALRGEKLDVWLPSEQIFPGDNWAEQISRALQECEAMVALLTPGAMRSGNIEMEMGYALGSKQYRHRLIPVLVGDAPVEDMPWILQKFHYVRWNPDEGIESLAREIVGALMAAA
ncbi:MAG: toll/interleukin-1 receptor domain-containing protein [Verrucomicrobia bacterium]|nr:toll/interleukin-1 receptor domain-containing protein [Verrucomicrobiota bacterium]